MLLLKNILENDKCTDFVNAVIVFASLAENMHTTDKNLKGRPFSVWAIVVTMHSLTIKSTARMAKMIIRFLEMGILLQLHHKLFKHSLNWITLLQSRMM